MLPEASSIAPRIDALFWSMMALCGLVAIGVFVAMMVFCIRYRRGSQADRTGAHSQSLGVELTWTLVPFALFMTAFIWSLSLFVQARTSAQRRADGLCRRQAMDVEGAASRGSARDQRAACAAGQGRAPDA